MTVILTPLLSISVANPPSNINNLPSSKFIIKHSVRGWEPLSHVFNDYCSGYRPFDQICLLNQSYLRIFHVVKTLIHFYSLRKVLEKDIQV